MNLLCRTVVVGSYSSFVPSTLSPEYSKVTVCLTTISLFSRHLRCCLLCHSQKLEERRVVLCCIESTAILVRGNVAIITETESTLHHDQVHLVV